MAFSNTSGGPLRAEINITPMIDILLVLIIVFMVVVSMSQEKGLKAQIPQPATEKSPPPERTIVIQIAWSGDNKIPTIKINDEDVPWEKLHDRLSTIFTGRVERVAFVKGDDDVDFEFVADAIDIARTSGVERIGLLTKTGPETPQ
jgi:biopolymer transport protein ExbD